MNEFKLTVALPGLPEAITALAEALKTRGGEHPAPAAPAPVNPAPAAPASPAPLPPSAPAAAPATEAKTYRVEDLGRAGAALIDRGMKEHLVRLLQKYGVRALTQLDPAVYPAFAEDMRALGAAV